MIGLAAVTLLIFTFAPRRTVIVLAALPLLALAFACSIIKRIGKG